jgi:hypothetical protein
MNHRERWQFTPVASASKFRRWFLNFSMIAIQDLRSGLPVGDRTAAIWHFFCYCSATSTFED